MSKFPEAHKIIESIEGAEPPGSWAEEGHTSRIDICVEIVDGEAVGYVAALSENETTVRVDLDEHGWERLGHRAADVLVRLKAAKENGL